ncbi:MAG: ABC transporter permease [Bdellovibrionaceae bacterium]|nr:ABC transporter permease [Pseudobdellovibrionaceae bacterium]
MRFRVLVIEVGQLFEFALGGVRLFFTKPYRFDELIVHMEFIGNKSLGIILLSGLFTGMALAYQIFLGFRLVNAVSLVGPTVGLGITRELGPVLTGLIVSARAGGAMIARIGTMRVTEQIDALEVMGVNPIQYLVSPRIIAAVVVMPLLTGVFDFIAMVGCWVICIKLLDMDEAAFFDRTYLWLEPYHINEGLFKAAVFGLFFAVICTQRGYTTKGGAEGVGSATNRGVVLSMVMIIALDFFLTNFINMYYNIFGLHNGR